MELYEYGQTFVRLVSVQFNPLTRMILLYVVLYLAQTLPDTMKKKEIQVLILYQNVVSKEKMFSTFDQIVNLHI